MNQKSAGSVTAKSHPVIWFAMGKNVGSTYENSMPNKPHSPGVSIGRHGLRRFANDANLHATTTA
jgi:hypothetical protein